MLSDKDLQLALIDGSLVVESEKNLTVRPGSICLHLSNDLLFYEVSLSSVDFSRPETYPKLVRKKICDVDGYTLKPSEFVLVATLEKVGLSEALGGSLSNLSGLARLGLNVLLSTHVAPGYGGNKARAFTLEVYNNAPFAVVLRPGMRICHLVLHKMASPASIGYDDFVPGKYELAPSGSEYMG
ncbi:dCTP deaminase [Pseudomonas fluorescens]|jgi:dCTP deaminase|uniref:dCTP deaminase n=1 Tax=Pseudomonas fluorescens TaxID=294 RepID=A0A5E7KDW6_PSEFL|nr:dCTP deaminase [Pseudomonas fluorescens]VVO99085.1 dCTP deaminase [Pseudomonas fluorescens]